MTLSKLEMKLHFQLMLDDLHEDVRDLRNVAEACPDTPLRVAVLGFCKNWWGQEPGDKIHDLWILSGWSGKSWESLLPLLYRVKLRLQRKRYDIHTKIAEVRSLE